MATKSLSDRWSLRLSARLATELREHLFPGDGDEHGAVIGARVVTTAREHRLLATRLFLASDGTDYVAGQRGYRMLTADFVRRCAIECGRQGLAYLAVHCHGGDVSVSFSPDDLASHERGYGALLDIVNGPPVGAVVFARSAAAGEIWLPDRTLLELLHTDVVARIPQRLHPSPPPPPPHVSEAFDRQARLLGDRGQRILADQKVGIIGLGGAGSLINEYLARLGVGHIVGIDPDRVDITNLSRLVGARRSDALPWLTGRQLPRSIRRLGESLAAPKVRVAKRVARQAGSGTQFDGFKIDVATAAATELLVDCDFIFLAADSMQARLVTNALIHQFLIPGIQVGVKVQIDEATGDVLDVFSVVRHLVPGETCLWCNGLINPATLAEEAVTAEQRRRQRYVPEVVAPSVITMNAMAASRATNDYLFAVTGLAKTAPLRWHKFHPLHEDPVIEIPRRDPDCPECVGRLGAGRARSLPVRSN